jgi:hypothetical protein
MIHAAPSTLNIYNRLMLEQSDEIIAVPTNGSRRKIFCLPLMLHSS